jgi:hypothetical protein
MRHFVRNFLYCFCQPPQDPKVTPGKMLLVAEFFTYDGTAATVRSAQLASSAIAATEAFGQAECTGQIFNQTGGICILWCTSIREAHTGFELAA